MLIASGAAATRTTAVTCCKRSWRATLNQCQQQWLTPSSTQSLAHHLELRLSETTVRRPVAHSDKNYMSCAPPVQTTNSKHCATMPLPSLRRKQHIFTVNCNNHNHNSVVATDCGLVAAAALAAVTCYCIWSYNNDGNNNKHKKYQQKTARTKTRQETKNKNKNKNK